MPSHPTDVLATLSASGPALGPDVVSLYAFGSVVDGRQHRESDLDVGVLFDYARCPTRRDRFDRRLRLSAALEQALGRSDIDLVVLNDAPPQLARHIVNRGRRVHCRDAALDHAFVRTTLLRAADLEPFLRRTRKVKLEALGR